MALKKSDFRAIIKNENATDEEKISELLNLVHEEVDAVKDERDNFAEELKTVKAELKSVKDSASADESEWEAKYNAEHKAFEDYKTEQANKETRAAKETAYKSLLGEIGISDKIADLLTSQFDFDSIEVEDGKIKGADGLIAKYKDDYKDYIVQTDAHGVVTQQPPAGGSPETDLGKLSMEDYIKARQKK